MIRRVFGSDITHQTWNKVRLALVISMTMLLLITTAVIAGEKITAAPPITTAVLVNVIDTSIWAPASPDPAGIAFYPTNSSLYVSDSEVDGIPELFEGDNVFISTLTGSLVDSQSTMKFSSEPSGLTINTANNHFYIADDDQRRIYEIHPGADGIIGTDDDLKSHFSTASFGSLDPEGVAYGDGELFVSDSEGAEVYRINPGPNNIFDGVHPEGDDSVTHFDTLSLGVKDPQGIEYNYVNQTLFFTGGTSDYIVESTKQGVVTRLIDISALPTIAASGLALGRTSNAPPTSLSLYMSDRGNDEGLDPDENDGRIFEITFDNLQLDGIYLPTMFKVSNTQ